MRSQSGFTLVEIAIVLVIVGLIMGGVLKGYSLIESARVRSIVTDLNGIRAAWYGFQDRYHAIPGDFAKADVRVSADLKNGDGDGNVEDTQEAANVWQHLASSGFIAGSFDGSGGSAGTINDAECASSTCPQNPFSGFYKIAYAAEANGVSGKSNQLFTGGKIPVAVMQELDTKLDDGLPDSGHFRVHKKYVQLCTASGEWDIASEHSDCAGVLLQ